MTQSANSQDLRPARAVAQNRIWRKKSVVIFSLAQLAIRFVGGKLPDRPFGPHSLLVISHCCNSVTTSSLIVYHDRTLGSSLSVAIILGKRSSYEDADLLQSRPGKVTQEPTVM